MINGGIDLTVRSIPARVGWPIESHDFPAHRRGEVDRACVGADDGNALRQEGRELAQIRLRRDVTADGLGQVTFARSPSHDRPPGIAIDYCPESAGLPQLFRVAGTR